MDLGKAKGRRACMGYIKICSGMDDGTSEMGELALEWDSWGQN